MSALAWTGLLLGSTVFLLWRRRGREVPLSLLRVEARVSLAPRAGLALVQTGDERLIVAWGEASPRLIARVDPAGAWEMPPPSPAGVQLATPEGDRP